MNIERTSFSKKKYTSLQSWKQVEGKRKNYFSFSFPSFSLYLFSKLQESMCFLTKDVRSIFILYMALKRLKLNNLSKCIKKSMICTLFWHLKHKNWIIITNLSQKCLKSNFPFFRIFYDFLGWFCGKMTSPRISGNIILRTLILDIAFSRKYKKVLFDYL